MKQLIAKLFGFDKKLKELKWENGKLQERAMYNERLINFDKLIRATTYAENKNLKITKIYMDSFIFSMLQKDSELMAHYQVKKRKYKINTLFGLRIIVNSGIVGWYLQ